LSSNEGFSVVAPMKSDGAVLDERQERVLLRLVEAMHLVEEQHGAPAPLARSACGARPRRARP
jgi:hypothetical protein